MLPRPQRCEGCPRNSPKLSVGFVPGHGPADARLLILGEQPGRNEILQGKPFVGASGKEVGAGLAGTPAYLTNVRKCLGVIENEPRTLRESSIEFCTNAYLKEEIHGLPAIVTMLLVGGDALKAAVGVGDPVKHHGSVWTAGEAAAIAISTAFNEEDE